MTADIEKKQLKELREIADGLEEIRMQSTSPKASFLRGVVQGAGAVVGGILALTIFGWFLGLLGIIPGFDSFENYLKGSVTTFEHRY